MSHVTRVDGSRQTNEGEISRIEMSRVIRIRAHVTHIFRSHVTRLDKSNHLCVFHTHRRHVIHKDESYTTSPPLLLSNLLQRNEERERDRDRDQEKERERKRDRETERESARESESAREKQSKNPREKTSARESRARGRAGGDAKV